MEQAYEIVDRHIECFLGNSKRYYSPYEVLSILQDVRKEINDVIINDLKNEK